MAKIKHSVCNAIVDETGKEYKSIRELARKLSINKDSISRALSKKNFFKHENVIYTIKNQEDTETEAQSVGATNNDDDVQKWYNEAKELSTKPFSRYEIKEEVLTGSRYAIALFSDVHIEETVEESSVLGLNEYNIDIARTRLSRYFVRLCNKINEDGVKTLIFASLGDTISGFIHEELAQCNGLTPLEATIEAQNIIFSGLNYICENTSITNFTFIGITGNHSRVTKKVQHSNGYKLSYEWMMYKNIEKECSIKGLPIEFIIPDSEIAFLEMPDKKRFIFCHGHQIKGTGTGTVCGIYPSLQRLALKWGKTFKQDRIFLGHFHSCVSIPSAVVNGSVIGYNSYSLSNGFEYEKPSQQYLLYDTELGEISNSKIYV